MHKQQPENKQNHGAQRNAAAFQMKTKWIWNETGVGVGGHLIDLYGSLPPTRLV